MCAFNAKVVVGFNGQIIESCPLCSAEADSKDVSAAKIQDQASGAKQRLEEADMMQVTRDVIVSSVVAPECASPK
jgi:hypothetical protein